MKVCVFLGPSLDRQEAQRTCEGVYHPPARRGDIARALTRDHPDVIALIDGYFEQVPAVWHKEILYAMAHGVVVTGAASMGALRAAELSQFGMVGVGRIFEAYRTGRFAPFEDPFENDDEVAVIHGPQELGFLATDALVDMRATFATASDAGVISQDDAAALVAVARSIFYKERSYDAVLDRAARSGEVGATVPVLREWLPDHKVFQKREDSRALLGAIAAGTLNVAEPAFRFENTLLWDDWHRRLDEAGS